MADSFGIEFDKSGIDGWLDGVVSAFEKGIRPSAQAGAQVFYDEVKLRVGQIGKVTGNLQGAIYQAYSEKKSSADHATYHISWNYKKAPHGHLLEYGHIQRYKSYVGSDGRWYTAIRPSKRGQPRPKRKASLAEKDAYYVPLPMPKQIPAKSFLRGSFEAKFQAALDAANARMSLEVSKAIGGK